MKRTRSSYSLIVAALLLAAFASVAAAQDGKRKQVNKTPVLWEQVNIGRQDLFYGPGGRKGVPDTSRVTLIKEEKGGYSKKYRIKDADGKTWVAKIGKEAQSETAAVRLIAALGYKSEINYLVPAITIPGKGTFRNVRLEARPEPVDREGEWQWDKNPFVGTNELQGLKIMMALLNNWDMKNSNNRILETKGRREYIISDLGATFGKMGKGKFALLRWIGRSRNNPEDYRRSKFVKGVKKNRLKVHFNGKNHAELDNVTRADARWLADRLNQLSERQIRDAFRAARYSSADIDILTRAVMRRIEELDRASLGPIAATR